MRCRAGTGWRARARVRLVRGCRRAVCRAAGQTGLRQLTDELWAEDSIHPDIVFEATEIPTMEGLVAAGFGVAVVPVPRDGGDAKVVHVPLTNLGAKREVGLVWDRPSAVAAGERFVTFLKAIHAVRPAVA